MPIFVILLAVYFKNIIDDQEDDTGFDACYGVPNNGARHYGWITANQMFTNISSSDLGRIKRDGDHFIGVVVNFREKEFLKHISYFNF